MTLPKLPLVYNPRSGPRGKDPEALLCRVPKEVRDRVEPMSFGPPWDFTPLIEQAAAARGPLLVWGGDGTIHHAGRALVEAGCPVPLGALPGGSGNGLVGGLRTPLSPSGALLRLLQGREIRMDLPRLDGQPFLGLCGTGLEAAIAHAFDKIEGRGFLNYMKLSARLWRIHPLTPLQWEAERADAEPHTRRERLRAAWRGGAPPFPEAVFSLCFANLPQYGSGLWIAPGADPTDGLLQWVHLRRPGLLDLLTQVPHLFREGGHTHLRTEGRLRRAQLRFETAVPWHLDGEPAPERDRAELTLEPGAFRMQVTGDCPW